MRYGRTCAADRKTFVLEDASGREAAEIQERKVSVRDKIAIEREARTVATVRTALVGIQTEPMTVPRAQAGVLVEPA